MISYNSGFAINLLTVKSIYIEYLKLGGNLVFELNNLIIPFNNPETEETELRSFPNEPVKYYIEGSDSLRAYFEEWVDMWQESKIKL